MAWDMPHLSSSARCSVRLFPLVTSAAGSGEGGDTSVRDLQKTAKQADRPDGHRAINTVVVYKGNMAASHNRRVVCSGTMHG